MLIEMRFILSSLLGYGCLLSLLDLITCWDLVISSDSLESNDTKVNITCTATGLSGCQFHVYDYEYKKDKYINCEATEHKYWRKNAPVNCNSGIKYGGMDHCSIELQDVISGRYVVGCRATSFLDVGGGWKYKYTTLFVHDDTVSVRHLEADPQIAAAGEAKTLTCPYIPYGKKLKQCLFSMPNSNVNDNINLRKEPANKTGPYRYHGIGLNKKGNDYGECGMKIVKVSEEDNGVVWCRVKFLDDRYDVRAFTLIVAKPPTTATITYHKEEGNTVRANCSVSASRPVAHITWVNQEGQVVRNDTRNNKEDDRWFWPWDEQSITQIERRNVNNEKGKIKCQVRHPGLQKVLVPSVTVDITSLKFQASPPTVALSNVSGVNSGIINDREDLTTVRTTTTPTVRESTVFVNVESWQMKLTPADPVLTMKPHQSMHLECSSNNDVPLVDCGFQIHNGPYYNVSGQTEPITHKNYFKLENNGTDLKNGVCGLSFTALATGGTYRIGCRGRTKQGGWKYAYTTLDLEDHTTCHLTQFFSNETVLPGANVTIACRDDVTQVSKICLSTMQRMHPEDLYSTPLCAFNQFLDPCKPNLYNKDWWRNGYCGLIIPKVKEEDNGIIGLKTIQISKPTIRRTVFFPVAKPPQEARLSGVLPEYQLGETLEASCTASESRPLATITWYLGDDVINNTDDVTIEEQLDDRWRWMINATTTTQRFRKTITENDNGKNISCVVHHVALEDPLRNTYQIRLPIPNVPSCGNWKPNLHLVTGGQDATSGQFPWHAALYGRHDDGRYEYFCGGTLIKPNVVVTAAHCVYSERLSDVRNASELSVGLGKLDRDYNGDPRNDGVQTSDVDSIVIYRHYRGSRTNTQFDIALLKLTSPVHMTATVGVACMEWDIPLDEDEEELMAGVIGTVSGWGVNTAYVAGPRTLQWINLPWISQNSCIQQTEHRSRNFITPDKFCAGFVNKTKSVCRGDSGGGYMVLKNGSYFLKGVVSTALSYRTLDDDIVCSAEHFTTFTSISRFTPWLKRHILRFANKFL